MADALALARATTNTQRMKSAMKNMWDERKQLKAANTESASLDMVLRGQIDEVFLVLAHLGEAILPLGVFNKDYYLQTLGEVQAAIASCGNELLLLAWAELDAELQYVCTAGMAFCACYAPMPVYRGFGACVLSDYDWACPDVAYLDEKAKKKALWTVYGVKQRTDAQPTRSVFLAFDQTIQLLQVKSLAFLEKRPVVSSFAEHQPKYGAKPKREVKDDHELLEDWLKQLERHGHPGLSGNKTTSWGIPFATWTSPFSCHIMKTVKDSEMIAYHQMDPGRLLHGFLFRGNANLDEGQILMLMPGSPSESILSWLEGLPGTSHKIVRWQHLDTTSFESKISKSMRKKIGKHPLPTHFAVRDPHAGIRSPTTGSTSSPNILEHPNTVSPPPYSIRSRARESPTAELGPPDPREMAATPVTQQVATSSQSTVATVPRQIPGLPGGIARMGVAAGLKSIHTLRRMPSGTPAATSVNPSISIANTTDRPERTSGTARELDSQPVAVELAGQSNIVEAPSSGPQHIAELSTDSQMAPSEPFRATSIIAEQSEAESSSQTIEHQSNVSRHTSGVIVNHGPITEVSTDLKDTGEASQSNNPVLVVTEPKSSDASQASSISHSGVTGAADSTSVKRKQLPGAAKVEPSDSIFATNVSRENRSGPDTISIADEYLDLLKRVAMGDLTPPELHELLKIKGVLDT